MSKNSSGPWSVDGKYEWVERWEGGQKKHYRVVGPNGDAVTPIAVCSSNAKAIDNLANAHLISAAPEMLSALQTADQFLDHMKNSWEVCGHTQAMIDAVKAAIAKATRGVQ